MAITFLEAGTDTTHDTVHWDAVVTTGVHDSAGDQAYTGLRSIKGVLAAPGASVVRKGGVLQDAGTRLSFRYRYTGSAPNSGIIFCCESSYTNGFYLHHYTDNILYLNTTATGFGGGYACSGALSADTWYVIEMAWVITSTTDFQLKVWVDGVLWRDVTEAEGTIIASVTALQLGNGGAAGVSTTWIDDIYVDSNSTLDNIGGSAGVQVTNKRPVANGPANDFDTTTPDTGGSGYGTGYSIYVNEVAGGGSSGDRRHIGTTLFTLGTSSISAAVTTTSCTVVINANVQKNDLLIAAFVNRGATADPTVTDNDTGGNTWTKLATRAASTNGAISVWYKFAAAGTASKTITASGFTDSCSGGVTPIRGVSKVANPFSLTTVVSEGNASGDETQAAINVAVAHSMVFLVVGNTANDTNAVGSQASTNPTVLTEQFEAESSGGLDCSIALACAVKTTSGTTGAFTWAQVNGTTASMAFALEPSCAETYEIEAASVGHESLTGATVLGRGFWSYARGESTDTIYDNGTPVVPSPVFTTSGALCTVFTVTSTYPTPTGAAVGMGRPVPSANMARIYEMGMLVAYAFLPVVALHQPRLRLGETVRRAGSW